MILNLERSISILELLPRGHTFCQVDSITEEHELIEDIVNPGHGYDI